MKSKQMIRFALEDVEKILRGLDEDPKDPIWKRRAWRLWNYGAWDVEQRKKIPTKSHMPTAIKILRWVLGEQERE
ncbi:MAG: hypothetical protein DRP02_12375 [Candidatus Gerdarchaeota archaeon]|nr:MAG: hypothetical protein DRP02_12375 [Candidatus Gerdarchaeota archaeon]